MPGPQHSQTSPNPVTTTAFNAGLKCRLKAHFVLHGAGGSLTELGAWTRAAADSFRSRASETLRGQATNPVCDGLPSPRTLKARHYGLILRPVIKHREIHAELDALERVTIEGSGYRPVRLVPLEKIGRAEKLLLAFDARAVFRLTGFLPSTARIVHGAGHRSAIIHLPKLIHAADAHVAALHLQSSNPESPPLILNKHCPSCEFELQCRRVALERDDLSLLKTLDEKAGETRPGGLTRLRSCPTPIAPDGIPSKDLTEDCGTSLR